MVQSENQETPALNPNTDINSINEDNFQKINDLKALMINIKDKIENKQKELDTIDLDNPELPKLEQSFTKEEIKTLVNGAIKSFVSALNDAFEAVTREITRLEQLEKEKAANNINIKDVIDTQSLCSGFDYTLVRNVEKNLCDNLLPIVNSYEFNKSSEARDIVITSMNTHMDFINQLGKEFLNYDEKRKS